MGDKGGLDELRSSRDRTVAGADGGFIETVLSGEEESDGGRLAR